MVPETGEQLLEVLFVLVLYKWTMVFWTMLFSSKNLLVKDFVILFNGELVNFLFSNIYPFPNFHAVYGSLFCVNRLHLPYSSVYTS